MKLRPAMRKLFSKESHQKAQSAMEYLMTYGWAILIIAVVLGALFQLGVFNANNFAPKAPPGACQVFRPNGPGTTSFINLEGVCSGELPQYVSSFNGGNEGINTTTVLIANTIKAFTISAWIYVLPSATNQRMVVAGEPDAGVGVFALAFSNYPYLYFGVECYGNDGATVVNPGAWYNIVGVYNSGVGSTFVNGVNETHGSFSLGPNTPFAIGNGGAGCGGANSFIGQIANVQLYNTSLSASEIQALYLEGIGGAPIDLQNLVGWWPLNGNANDYSGNGNNGQATGVTYTGSWTSGYTPP
jgi:hypothetical protein